MSPITRRGLLAGTLLTGLAGCAPITSGQESATPTSPDQPGSAAAAALTVGLTYVPDIQFAPLYVADQLGYFTDEGLAVTLRHHGANEALLGALQSGDEDVVFAGGGEMLQARGQQVPVVDFATIYQRYPVVIAVPSDSPINSLTDLAGHSVGLPGEYGENWFYLLAALSEAGLTRADVDIQSIGFTQHAALTGAKVDAVVGYVNNDVVRFEQADFAIRTLTITDPPLVSLGFGALEDTMRARPDDLSAMLAAVKRGMQICVDDPEQAVEVSKDHIPNLSESEQQANALATLRATTPLYGDVFGVQDAARWDAMAEFFLAQQLVAAPVPASEAYTAEISG